MCLTRWICISLLFSGVDCLFLFPKIPKFMQNSQALVREIRPMWSFGGKALAGGIIYLGVEVFCLLINKAWYDLIADMKPYGLIVMNLSMHL